MSGAILKPDLCVIGAGSGGLSVAAGAVQMGASVVLIEKGAMGGDCLNAGCVPSKALIAAASAAQAMRVGKPFGITASAPKIDFNAVHDHVQAVIAGIAPHDSVARFEGLGVTVIKDTARFTDTKTVEAGGQTIKARRFVIATGSSPLIPPISGLDATPYLTNETVFTLRAAPDHLIVIGGGPIGVELAQAHRRLGSEVTLMEMGSILPKDDPDLVDCSRRSLIEDGVVLREGASVTGAEPVGDGVRVLTEDGPIEGSHLLIATGRKANVDGLGLDAAGIESSARGIAVDARLRTTNKSAFAIGDVVAGGLQFTHVAGYHAGIVIRNALFRLPAKAEHSAVPWVTYSDPELAQVGLNEARARERYGADAVTVLTAPFADNDRARTAARTEGLVKAVVTKKGKILGCGIAGPHAGELIAPWVLAMSSGLKIGALASMIAPYPTLGEASKRAAGQFYTPKLFGPGTRRLVRFLRIFG